MTKPDRSGLNYERIGMVGGEIVFQCSDCSAICVDRSKHADWHKVGL